MQPFNMAQWAEAHEDRDAERFKAMADNLANVWRVLAFAGVTLIGLLSWSLKLNVDQSGKQDKQLAAIYDVQRQVMAVSGQQPVSRDGGRPAIPNDGGRPAIPNDGPLR